MKTVLFHQHGGPEVLQYTDFPTPEPKPGEALIGAPAETKRADSRDAGLETGGLEFGDHVVINANFGCGQCEFCLIGSDNLCKDWHLLGETIRGTYAEYVSAPLRQLY